jgi:hypothetical protein
MADTKTDDSTTTAPADQPAQSLDDAVRVRDLASPHTNPNIPRSLFATPLSAAAASPDSYVSVTDGVDQPGDGFKSKSISGQAIQMSTGFDANGQAGNSGDWLVYAGGHWFVARDL